MLELPEVGGMVNTEDERSCGDGRAQKKCIISQLHGAGAHRPQNTSCANMQVPRLWAFVWVAIKQALKAFSTNPLCPEDPGTTN